MLCFQPLRRPPQKRRVDQDPIFLSPCRGPKQMNFRKIGSCPELQICLALDWMEKRNLKPEVAKSVAMRLRVSQLYSEQGR